MTSSSLRTGLFLLVVGSACTATVACGRVGLDADGFEIDGGLDGDLDSGFIDVSFDSGIGGDTGIRPDSSFLDTGIFIDSGRIDSGIFIDTGRVDSGVDTGRADTFIGFDSGRPDTFVGFDTAVPDTFVGFDTGLPDTFIGFDSDVPDTIVVFDSDFDTGIPPFDTGIDGGPIDGGGIVCGPGGLRCNPATEFCCAGFGTFSCTPTGGICGGTPLTCSSAASCKTGEVCCFSGGIGGSATCAPFCFGIQLCALNSECTPPQRCMPVFGGYRVCR